MAKNTTTNTTPNPNTQTPEQDESLNLDSQTLDMIKRVRDQKLVSGGV